ncbi:cation:proton antiporter [Micromonospora sp. NPDC051925]|uniref:cation:proton antiporter n=1 Tax=Micromonospora sp. NPDC051925 TaxID=3364288 RepID=UPI0037C6C53B
MTMFALALILAAAHLLGALARRCGQPPVIGEILAGILLGPSLFDGVVSETLFPLDVRPHLVTLGNLGVALFMFVVGLELDHRLLRGSRRAAAGVSIGSIVFAFGLGCLLALHLWPDHRVASQLGFVLFMGAAMSITAFPVLARILTDRGIQHTRIGALAMASAAIGDMVAWFLLAAIVAFTGGQRSWQVLLAVPYLLVMLWVVRPLLGRIVAAQARGTRELTLGPVIVLIVLLLLSGGLSEWFGLHFIFGAFFAGVIIPRQATERLRTQISDRVGMVSWILLPAYFAVAGLNVNLAAVGGDGLGELALILLVAIGGKFVGAYTGARVSGQSGRAATTMGILMNTRGLTELIILGVGLQLHLLDTDLYSLMVVMAVVTTAMTAPLLRWSYPRQMVDADLLQLSQEWREAARTAPGRSVVARPPGT